MVGDVVFTLDAKKHEIICKQIDEGTRLLATIKQLSVEAATANSAGWDALEEVAGEAMKPDRHYELVGKDVVDIGPKRDF